MTKLTLVSTAPVTHTPENIAHMLVQSFKESHSEEKAILRLRAEGVTNEEFNAFVEWRKDNPAKIEDFY